MFEKFFNGGFVNWMYVGYIIISIYLAMTVNVIFLLASSPIIILYICCTVEYNVKLKDKGECCTYVFRSNKKRDR